MTSNRKRKFQSKSSRSIHPRNKYAENPPDFAKLASLYPSFSSYVFYAPNGRPRIDWTDFNATRELTRVLLDHDHGIKWWIPDGHLCPAVPNRSNYIHWIEDLLSSDLVPEQRSGDEVRGFDIGTGANCIYPLLGAALQGWHFVGTDVTQVALEWAEKNVQNNPHIADLIEIRKAGELENGRFDDNECPQKNEEASERLSSDLSEARVASEPGIVDEGSQISISVHAEEPCKEDRRPVELLSITDQQIDESLVVQASDGSGVFSKSYQGTPVLLGVIKEGEHFDFCMCNPPFFESIEEAGANPRTSCGGTVEEMVCPGGEQAFITRIMEDSIKLRERIRWYTTMVGRKISLKVLITNLRKVGVTMIQTTEFVQGRTSRWGLAWSFISPSKKTIVACSITEKSNLSFMLEGLQRHCSALHVLQSMEHFFLAYGDSCKADFPSFSVNVSLTDTTCEEVLNDCSTKYNRKLLDGIRSQSHEQQNSLKSHTTGLSFRVSVFEQSPGTLLVKGSLVQRGSSYSGLFAALFILMEETLKENLGAKCQQTLAN
eukprot:Gb_28580 [translate_table: standard]